MNGDKQYFLQKLREHNKAAEELSDYLARLVETSEQLAAQEGNDPYDDDCPSDQPKRWLAGLPVRQIPLPVLNLNRHGGLPEKPKRR